MLDRLPPELIDHILLLAVEPEPRATSTGSTGRQSTLKACSLVCRALRQRAQPMLWRVVRLWTRRQAANLEAAIAGDHGFTTRTEHLQLQCENDMYIARTMVFLPLFPNLVTLSLSLLEDEEVNVYALAALPHLRVLEIHRATIKDAVSDVVSPHLVELSLSHISVYRVATLTPLFQQSTLPALKALSLCRLLDTAATSPYFLPRLPSPLTDQLDILVLASEDLDLIQTDHCLPQMVLTLGYEPGLRDPSPSSALSACQHFAFTTNKPSPSPTIPGSTKIQFDNYLFSFASLSFQMSCTASLRTVFLPTILPVKDDHLFGSSFAECVDVITDTCAKHEVDVVLFEADFSCLPAAVQPEIWRHLRRERDEQEEQEEEMALVGSLEGLSLA
ncbi:hypothetical protein JCM6882_007670 [Rhodosporidiobolus microsporus]